MMKTPADLLGAATFASLTTALGDLSPQQTKGPTTEIALVPSLALCSPDGRTAPWAQHCCITGPARSLMCSGPALQLKAPCSRSLCPWIICGSLG